MPPNCKWKSPMRSLSQRMTCGSLFLLFCLTQSYSYRPTYHWKDRLTGEDLVCEKCQPGTSVAQHCTKDSPTICQPCRELHYTEYWNYLEYCLYCSVFCNDLEEEAQPCNSTQNRVCQCKPGYHSDTEFCIKHSKCPLGSGAAQPGNAQQDTKCTQCPQGTFSSTSSMDPCQPHQNCSAKGLEVNVPGSRFHDAFCTACSINKANETADGLNDISGDDDCQDALIDFVPYEVKAPRRLRRLKRILGSKTPPPGRGKKKSPEELQVELHNYLLQLKNMGTQELVQKLLGALQHMKLHHIQQKIQKRFPTAF